MSELSVTRSISNLGLSKRQALLMGIDKTRDFLRESGADSLALTPMRSKLLSEIMREIRLGRFENSIGGTALIGVMDQSFAPTFSEIGARFAERRAQGEGLITRLKKLGRESLIERGILPPAEKSLMTMNKIAGTSNAPLFGNLYVEHLPPGYAADYETSVQLTADTLQNLGVEFDSLPGALFERGIGSISFSSYNTSRKSLDGTTELPDWREWLADFSRQGLIRQVAISVNRTDLPDLTGTEPMSLTHALGNELAKINPDITKLGDLPEQLQTIFGNLPSGHTLDLNLRGPVGAYSTAQIKTIFTNINEIATATQT